MPLLDNILIFTRLLLIGVFFVSGISKLSDRQSFYEALINFGIPKEFHKIIGFFLPWLEVIIAICLLLPFSVWWGSIASLILMILFTIIISYNLLKKRYPACNCFGASDKPIDAFSVIRNIGFMACCIFIVMYGPKYEHINLVDWFANIADLEGEAFSFLFWFLAIIACTQGWVILKLFRQHGRIILRLDNIEYRLDASGVKNIIELTSSNGLPVGEKAPGFSLSNLDGNLISLDSLVLNNKPIILVFTDPNCGPCVTMLPNLAEWNNELKSEITIVLLSRSSNKDNVDKYRNLHIENIIFQTNREIAEQYKATSTPSAVRINSNGLIDSKIALGEIAIAALLYESRTSS